MLGLTVSAPVFDRSLNPPVLVGVVGLDFPMSALDMALGVPIGSGATLEKVALSSTAKCPRLDLSSCQLESFRAFGIAGSDALCAANCTGEVENISVEAKACQNRGDLPARLLANRAKEGSSTTERICCPSDGGNFTEQCSSSIAAEADADQALKSSTAADDGSTGPNPLLIAVITLAGVIVLGGILLVYFRPWHRSQQRTNNPWVRRKEEENGTSHASVYGEVHPMPPPSTNPRRYPEFASAPIDA